MARLGIGYDLLARESEILHLHFWDAAFAKLKESGAIHLAASGKMAGCWVMPWREEGTENAKAVTTEGGESAEKTETDEENSQDKIIVRSNGTVTYVGKDIAYQLWKFGLLGKDFNYAKWPKTPAGKVVWSTTSRKSDPSAPNFGEPAVEVYNVIDARQAYLQKVVAAGVRALGHAKEADHSIHLSYEIVALTPRCAAEMGYTLSAEEAKKPYVEVSGRKGLGVKADDLIDKLEAATLAEVQQRHAEMSVEEQTETAHTIAVGALRFFLLKFTRTAIIAFDFKDALSFEGETGPYCQYAVVRIRGIRRKGLEGGEAGVALTRDAAASLLGGADGDGFWELLLKTDSLDYAVDAVIGAQEPAFLAKYAFQLAQAFNLSTTSIIFCRRRIRRSGRFCWRSRNEWRRSWCGHWSCWGLRRRRRCEVGCLFARFLFIAWSTFCKRRKGMDHPDSCRRRTTKISRTNTTLPGGLGFERRCLSGLSPARAWRRRSRRCRRCPGGSRACRRRIRG